MGTVRTDEFRKYAVRMALTSGISRKQVADDLGVGMSTLNKWITAYRDTDVGSVGRRLCIPIRGDMTCTHFRASLFTANLFGG